jgi:hypothetical protein
MVLIFWAIGVALTVAAETWIGYIAIEPLVRRRWPRMLIGTSRLLAGRFRDPMIGRDFLVGGTVGVMVVLLRQLTTLLPGAVPLQSVSLMLSGLRYVGWFFAASLALALVVPIIAATLLVGLRVMTRSVRASVIITALLVALLVLGDVSGPLWGRAIFGVLVAVVVLIILFRFGLLAFAAAFFSYVFLRRVPITLDPSAWYFGRSMFAVILLIAIALYGFIISLGGKRWLPEVAVDA